MSQFYFRLIFVIGLMVSPISSASMRTALTPDGIFKRYKDAVVRIEVVLHGASLGVGSGFFFSPKGEIATSLHVVRPWLTHPEAEIRVRTSGGQTFRQVQVGNCSDSRGIDLCLLKVDHKVQAFLPANATKPQVGVASKVAPGESVVTIGHPRGLDFSISTGVVSAIRENPAGWNEIQVDAAISPGNSGGPIINSLGEVVGVVYQFERDGQNLNFGITTDELESLLGQSTDGGRNSYQRISDARRRFLDRGRRISKRAVEKLMRPAILSLANTSNAARPVGFKWMKVALDKKPFMTLVPEVIQSCEQADEGEGVSATSCASNGGDLILTIQRRHRTLEGAMETYRGRRLVAPRRLHVVDRLEAEGEWSKMKSFEGSFVSRPGIAKCQRFLRNEGRVTVVAADENAILELRSKNHFQNATAVCRFETENDAEPGAISFSQWIEQGKDFYGINVWTADPSHLPFAQSLADLVLASAGSETDQNFQKPYRVTLRMGMKRVDSILKGRWIANAEHYDLFQDERSSIVIAKTTAIVPSQMNRTFSDMVQSVAKANGLRLNVSGTVGIESGMSHGEVGGQTGRFGSWVATSANDRSKSFVLHLATSFGANATWVLAEVERLDAENRSQVNARGKVVDSYGPASRSIATFESIDLAKKLQAFRTWVQDFETVFVEEAK